MHSITQFIPENLRQEEFFKHVSTVWDEYILHLYNVGYLDIDIKNKGVLIPDWKPSTKYNQGDRVAFRPNFWGANVTTTVGTWVQPLVSNGKWYKCISSGVGAVPGLTGVTAPIWPTTNGQTVVDFEVVWQCMPNTGFYYRCLTAGMSGAAYPQIDTIVTSGSILQDNTARWISESIDASGPIIELYKEFGYGYILDMFTLTAEELTTLDSYLHLIHYLKGSKSGLELVLNLLRITYRIEEWWEEPTVLDPWQFELYANLNQSSIKPDTVYRIREFVKNYVYPELILLLEYSSTDIIKVDIADIHNRVLFGKISTSTGGFGYNYGNNFGNITYAVWAGTTSYVIGAQVQPTVNNGFYYQANNGAVSGGSQPIWPTVIGNTVVDGGITWTCAGVLN